MHSGLLSGMPQVSLLKGESMSELESWVVSAYEKSKKGEWHQLVNDWEQFPTLAKRCSRYKKPSSGWTFLHQAAYFGNEDVCRLLIRLGASIGVRSSDGETASEIAKKNGHIALADWLAREVFTEDNLWAPPVDPDALPSSGKWGEAIKCRASEPMLVSYAGGLVKIPRDQTYYEDSLGRILVGWHGSYDPPCGMDGEPMW